MSDDGVPHDAPVAGVRSAAARCSSRLAGELDLYNSHVVREALLEAAGRGPERLLVELSEVEFIDSTALGVLIEARSRLADGRAFMLVAPNSRRAAPWRSPGSTGISPCTTRSTRRSRRLSKRVPRGHVWGQELISKWFCEDEDHAEVEEGEVVVGFAVAAGRDPSFRFQPGVGSFDGPAVSCLRVTCFDPSFLAAPDLADDLARGDRLPGATALADPCSISRSRSPYASAPES